MSGEKILVIEDEENILEAIKYSLTREGYEVYGATDGEKGLEVVLLSYCADLIVSKIFTEISSQNDIGL